MTEVGTFTDNETIDVPGQPIAVFTPGHTQGHASLHLPDRGVLISGDALITVDVWDHDRTGPRSIRRQFNHDHQQAIRSLERLAELDVEMIFPGRGEPWRGSLTVAVEMAERVGPHYCPRDDPSTPAQEPGVIYVDETFFDAVLERQLGATGGDVAEAYVIAHEVGHHVQNELGITSKVTSLQQQDPSQANTLSVSMELQADCFAGVWAGILEGDVIAPTELRQAIDAAEAVGDDRIQRKTTGMVTAETWTHGSAEERVSWFMTGHDTQDPNACNPFDA